MKHLSPGCVRSNKTKKMYLPIIFVAHGKIYFSGETFSTPSAALSFAQAAIDEGVVFKSWHAYILSAEVS